MHHRRVRPACCALIGDDATVVSTAEKLVEAVNVAREESLVVLGPSTPLAEALSSVDVAYLDGTFYGEGEIPGRNMAEIPHPFMVETLALLAPLPPEQRAKVRFIHLNHTNPALDPESEATQNLTRAGVTVVREGERIGL